MAEDLAARRRIRRDLKPMSRSWPRCKTRSTRRGRPVIWKPSVTRTTRPPGAPEDAPGRARVRSIGKSCCTSYPRPLLNSTALLTSRYIRQGTMSPGPMSSGKRFTGCCNGHSHPRRPPSLGHHDMAKLSKVDAANAAGVSRQTLYTYIKDRRINVDTDGLVGTAELLRAGCTLHTLHEIGRQDLEPVGHNMTSKVDTLDVYLDMITLLKQQRSDAQARNRPPFSANRVPANVKRSCGRCTRPSAHATTASWRPRARCLRHQ